MIPVPRWLLPVLGSLLVVNAALQVVARAPRASHPGVQVALALALLAVGMLLVLLRPGRDLPRALLVAALAVVIAMPLLSAPEVDPARAFADSAWWVNATGVLAAVLVARRAQRTAWAALGLLALHTLLWAGPAGLLRFSVVAVVLLTATLSGGAHALRAAGVELDRASEGRKRALAWEAAQSAHLVERRDRLAATAATCAPMLRRIVADGGRLSAQDRFECRVLEQTVRDEIRGRRLLNDAVREQVLAARRRGAFVQVHDDGGLDDIAPAVLEPLLDTVAATMAALSSERIVLRTANADTGLALTLVAVSVDPVAAALGLDDEGETVDARLELPRPVPVG